MINKKAKRRVFQATLQSFFRANYERRATQSNMQIRQMNVSTTEHKNLRSNPTKNDRAVTIAVRNFQRFSNRSFISAFELIFVLKLD